MNAHESPRALEWQWSAFDELTNGDLYAVMHLRQLVFIVEQACPYLDADGYDERARHLLGWLRHTGDARDAGNGVEAATPLLAAYVRIFTPGIKYAEASIGRVVTHPSVRRTGTGKMLMEEALRRVESLAPGAQIRIGAQMYLERFYEGFGFRRVSDPYDEDGILHIEMLRSGKK